MSGRLATYHLRRFINQIVQATEHSPSLAEMVQAHLEVDWSRQATTPFHAIFAVHNKAERFVELQVVDAQGYPDTLYQKGQALLKIGVNGALANASDEAFAQTIFGQTHFRSCRVCGQGFDTWFDYYGHARLEHWGETAG